MQYIIDYLHYIVANFKMYYKTHNNIAKHPLYILSYIYIIGVPDLKSRNSENLKLIT